MSRGWGCCRHRQTHKVSFSESGVSLREWRGTEFRFVSLQYDHYGRHPAVLGHTRTSGNRVCGGCLGHGLRNQVSCQVRVDLRIVPVWVRIVGHVFVSKLCSLGQDDGMCVDFPRTCSPLLFCSACPDTSRSSFVRPVDFQDPAFMSHPLQKVHVRQCCRHTAPSSPGFRNTCPLSQS